MGDHGVLPVDSTWWTMMKRRAGSEMVGAFVRARAHAQAGEEGGRQGGAGENLALGLRRVLRKHVMSRALVHLALAG